MKQLLIPLLLFTAINSQLKAQTITATGHNPSDCGLCDGYIELFFTDMPDGFSILNSSNGGPYSINISNGYAILGLGGLCAGSYEGLYVVSNGNPSNTVDVTLSDPNAPSAPTASGYTICDGDVVTNITATGDAGATFTWYNDAGLTTIVDSDDTWQSTGTVGTETIYVTQTDGSCESGATEVTVTIENCPIAIDDIQLTNISLYPNPTQQFINLENTYNIKQVNIYNISGELVLQTFKTQKINIEKLPPGKYVLITEDVNGQKMLGQFVKIE